MIETLTDFDRRLGILIGVEFGAAEIDRPEFEGFRLDDGFFEEGDGFSFEGAAMAHGTFPQPGAEWFAELPEDKASHGSMVALLHCTHGVYCPPSEAQGRLTSRHCGACPEGEKVVCIRSGRR